MSILNQPLKINGVVSTDKTVLQNLNELCFAAGAFLTFDISQGKWAVIINRIGTSAASFNDSNIIGSITVSETGVNELYNSAQLEFPHQTLRDQTDYVIVSVDPNVRYPNEIDNRLNIQSNVINDPVQAQYIAAVELKQSRLNRVITFTTDYSYIGLKAGDIIDVTAEMYGYSEKLFRIIKVEESDLDGVITINITGLEYSEDVYDTTGITNNQRSKKTGIILKEQNDEIQRLEDVDSGAMLMRLLAGNVALGLLNRLLNKLLSREIGPDGKPTGKMVPSDQAAEDIDKILSGAKRPEITSITAPEQICEDNAVTITVETDCNVCIFDIPAFDYEYTITGVSESDISVPLTGNITVENGSGTLSFIVVSDGIADNNETLTFTCGGQTVNITINDNLPYTYTTSVDNASITEGQSATVTLQTTGISNGTTIPYTISSDADGRVTTPLSGNVTVNNNQATLTVATTDDGVYTGNDIVIVEFNGAQADPCGQLDNTAVIGIQDNDSPPPSDTTCQFVEVPLVWCAVYDGSDNQLKGMSVARTVSIPKALAGEATVNVPLTVSVTKGNPSTITVVTTAAVASSSSLGGIPVKVITSFNSVAPNGLITGTTTTLTGY